MKSIYSISFFKKLTLNSKHIFSRYLKKLTVKSIFIFSHLQYLKVVSEPVYIIVSKYVKLLYHNLTRILNFFKENLKCSLINNKYSLPWVRVRCPSPWPSAWRGRAPAAPPFRCSQPGYPAPHYHTSRIGIL